MSKHLTRELVAEQAAIVAAPRKGHEVDRTFELPKALYGATVALYLGFLAVMATGLSTPGLIIPMTIFAFFIVAGFAIPAIWTKLEPASRSKQKSWAGLRNEGVATYTGRVSAKDAAVQMLLLPAIVFCWGIAAVTVAMLVR
ncbi:hypothetical protein [Qipengyuania sphaerica]|uniref:hypothetical protein n=1 Tax=Qipengyuania sphaerica TaxID=2867243 RepID=UPI001C88AA65|nr:hypothetical protein [Qipengyuania sphaerica]MBX7540978.1 hypothetical protein [Qipengyuania sphaerica]